MKSAWRILASIAILFAVGLALLQPSNNATNDSAAQRSPGNSQALSGDAADLDQQEMSFYASEPVVPTLSQPVRDLPLAVVEPYLDREINPRLNLNADLLEAGPGGVPGGRDSLLALQENAPQASVDAFLTPILNFNAQGYTFVNPPDTVGDVGPNHYIHMINGGGGALFVIYDKSGGVVAGPTALDSLGSGSCGSGAGDPIVLYDSLADRWLMSEFASSGNHLCVYISQSADPTGSWYNYDFTTPSFPDYPKYAVWHDAYYVSSNENSPAVYALDRNRMLAGLSATSQRFIATRLGAFGFQALTPSDLDGATAPPAGAPNYFMRHRDDEAHNPSSNDPTRDFLEIWQFHVDWNTPANSSFTGPLNVPVAEFDSELCGYTSFYCFPQQGSSTTLDPLREVIMWRLQYRNFGDHEALVGNLVTDVDGTNHGGVRWFELRKTSSSNWSLFQEGTFAPDQHHRWMGSVAMDGSGNIALGYSISSSSMYPSMRYAGRLSSDPLGTLPQSEGLIVNGTSANGSNRWGDYSAMSVDPADDCTFWHTNMYAESGHWNTRVATFKFDSCGAPDFTLEVTPVDQMICAGEDAIYVVDVGRQGDFVDAVTLSASGNPGSASFDPETVAPPGASTLTVSGAAAGDYAFDVVGVAGAAVHTATVGLQVAADPPSAPTLLTPVNGATGQLTTPEFTWSPAPDAASYAIEIATDPGFVDIVDSAVGLTATSYTPASALNTGALYYWRVQAGNNCGSGDYSAVFSFATEALPGDCPLDATPNLLLAEGFESGDPGWSHGGIGDTWALSSVRSHSGDFAYHAANSASVSDQWLLLPEIALPADETPLTLQFWNHQTIESSSGGCYDGAILELSTDGGGTWTQLEAELLTDPYDGPVSTSYSNPLAGLDAWCGDPQDWLNSVAALDGYAGQTVSLRFRLGTDSLIGREGWYIDDVVVQSCQPACTAPVAPMDVSISQSAGDAVLSWTDTGAEGYMVWRSGADAHFDPADPDCDCQLIATVAEPTFTDSDAIGNVAENYFYVVRAVNGCSDVSGNSNRTGEFDFAVAPGAP